MAEYKPVPVEAAHYVAHHAEKDVVVIVSIDRRFDKFHCTTYGKTASDKLHAAEIGDFLMLQMQGPDVPKQTFEDFRLEAATIKAQLEEAKAEIAKLKSQLSNP